MAPTDAFFVGNRTKWLVAGQTATTPVLNGQKAVHAGFPGHDRRRDA
jgi:hypothetical protein